MDSELILYESLQDGGIADILYKINGLESDRNELHEDDRMTTLEELINKAFEFGRRFERNK